MKKFGEKCGQRLIIEKKKNIELMSKLGDNFCEYKFSSV